MASSKRSWEGNIVSSNQQKPANPKEQPNPSSAMTFENPGNEEGPVIQSIFENFRSELDEHHDRRERIIKVSRDITALSKKMYEAPIPNLAVNFGLIYVLIAYSPYNGTVHTPYCGKPYPDITCTLESEQSMPPSRPTSPKKTKPASPKSSTFSNLSLPSSPEQTPGATNDKSLVEYKNSSKPSPSNTTSRRKASLRATKLPLNYPTGSS